MTHTQRRRRGKNWYLYRSTSRWIEGEVKTETEYLGPEGKGVRQAIDPRMMQELSALLMKPGLDEKSLKQIARNYELEMPVDSPRRIVLENNLLKKTLYVWIK